MTCGCHVKSIAPGSIPQQKFDVFVSYRSSTEKDVVEKIVYRLEAYKELGVAKNITCWWDRKDLEDGAPWVDGFCGGLKMSRYFMPLLSRRGLEHIKNYTSGQADNMLMEFETAVDILSVEPEFVIPLCVGEYVPVSDGASSTTRALVKFRDFDASNYPNVTSTTCGSRTVRETMQKIFFIQCIPIDPEDMYSAIVRIANRLSTPRLSSSHQQGTLPPNVSLAAEANASQKEKSGKNEINMINAGNSNTGNSEISNQKLGNI